MWPVLGSQPLAAPIGSANLHRGASAVSQLPSSTMPGTGPARTGQCCRQRKNPAKAVSKAQVKTKTAWYILVLDTVSFRENLPNPPFPVEIGAKLRSGVPLFVERRPGTKVSLGPLDEHACACGFA